MLTTTTTKCLVTVTLTLLIVCSMTYQVNGQNSPCQEICTFNLVCNTLATSCLIDSCTPIGTCYNFCARCIIPATGQVATTTCAKYCPNGGATGVITSSASRNGFSIPAAVTFGCLASSSLALFYMKY